MNKKGFTLLEVLIVIVILSFISLGIFNALRGAYQTRTALSTQGDFYSSIRLAMGILERDLSLLYSPVVMITDREKNNLTPDTVKALSEAFRGDEATVSDFWGPVIDPTGIRPSRFYGKDSSVHFVSSSNIRVYKESKESELAKVTYELRDTKRTEEFYQSTKSLTKIMSTDVFAIEDREDDERTKSYTILDGVKQLRFRFYSQKEDKWLEEWDSDEREFKNDYPELVEVELEVVGGENLTFEGRYKFRTELPFKGIHATL